MPIINNTHLHTDLQVIRKNQLIVKNRKPKETQ